MNQSVTVLTFTESELADRLSLAAHDSIARAMPRKKRNPNNSANKTGRCPICGEISYPFYLCKKHRNENYLRRVLNKMAIDGTIIKSKDPKDRRKNLYALAPKVPFVRDFPKVRRNDPCPCGSQKKYKQCCARKQSQENI